MKANTTPEAELIIAAFDTVAYLRSQVDRRSHERAATMLHQAACAMVTEACMVAYEDDVPDTIVRRIG